MHRVLTFAAVLALSACASMMPQPPAPISIRTLASKTDYEPYLTKGSATLTGQAFLTTVGGDVKKGAGRMVTLDPATPYSNEWYASYGTNLSRFAETPSAPEFASARRTTVADADGRFKFADLPAGSYIVRSTVTWDTGRYQYVSDTQGGVVSGVVTIAAGESKELILHR